MKKIFLVLLVMFGVISSPLFVAQATSTTICSVSSSNDNSKFVDQVKAQNQNGTASKTFNIYYRVNGNGSYYFYAIDSNKGEYTIMYAPNNHSKPFYVKIGNVRWYFASRDLDMLSGHSNQW